MHTLTLVVCLPAVLVAEVLVEYVRDGDGTDGKHDVVHGHLVRRGREGCARMRVKRREGV